MNESSTGLPLVLNPILFILAITLASRVFSHYETANAIFDLEPLQYDDHWILEWADHMQDVPVSRVRYVMVLLERSKSQARFSQPGNRHDMHIFWD